MGPTAKAMAVVLPQNGESSVKEAAIVPAEVVQPTPAGVLLEAVQRGASIETVTKLFELQERWEKREAKKAFDAEFAAFQKEAPELTKTKSVSHDQGKTERYKYTPLDVAIRILGPHLSKHGFSWNWTQIQTDGVISVTCHLKHVQGHEETNTLEGPPDDSGSKNKVQAISSGTSYLRRYTFLGATGRATGDEDSDGVTMIEAADFLTLIQESHTIEELGRNYKEATADALRKQSPKAVALYMDARKKKETELRG